MRSSVLTELQVSNDASENKKKQFLTVAWRGDAPIERMIVSGRCRGVMLNPAHGYTKRVQKPARPLHRPVCVLCVCARALLVCRAVEPMRCQVRSCSVSHSDKRVPLCTFRRQACSCTAWTEPPIPTMSDRLVALLLKKKTCHFFFFPLHTPAPAERPPCFGNPPPSPSRRGKLSG